MVVSIARSSRSDTEGATLETVRAGRSFPSLLPAPSQGSRQSKKEVTGSIRSLCPVSSLLIPRLLSSHSTRRHQTTGRQIDDLPSLPSIYGLFCSLSSRRLWKAIRSFSLFIQLSRHPRTAYGGTLFCSVFTLC